MDFNLYTNKMKVFSIIMLNILIYVACCLIVISFIAGLAFCTTFSSTINILKTIEVIKGTGANPDCIMYDSFSKKIFTFNGRSNSSSVIDTKTNKVVATIPLDGKPEFAATDGKGNIFVNIEDKSVINVIDAKNFKVIQHWSIAPGEEPSGLALDNETHRLFNFD